MFGVNTTEKVWSQVSHFFGILAIGAIFGMAAYASNLEIKDLDLWLHLGVGKYIVENQRVPAEDILSCTIQGKPWTNHEWLFQVLIHKIYQFAGEAGLQKMQTVVVVITMGILLLLGYSRDRQISVIVTLFMVFLLYQQRFTIRPDLFSLFFFAVYIYVLAIHIDKRWALPVLTLVQVIWSNMHGFFFFGPIFVLISLVSEWIKRYVPLPYEWNDSGRLTDAEYKRTKFILLFVVLACLVNPYGVAGAWYPFSVFFSLSGDSKIFFYHIEELQKPIQLPTMFQLGEAIYLKVFIFISAISFVLNRRRIDVSALMLWLVFLVFCIQAARNQPFFGFAAYLAMMTNNLGIDYENLIPIKFSDRKFQYINEAVLKGFLFFWIVQFAIALATLGYYDFENYKQKSDFGGVSLVSYPHKAVDFLVKNKVKGNFFNDFNSGAYLVGKKFPDIKVYIDGRTEVYGGEFFKNYLKFWGGDEKVAARDIEKYQLTGALLNSLRQNIQPKLLKYFYTNPEWALVYFDYDAVIFLKNTQENQEIISKYRIDLSKWVPPAVDLVRLGTVLVDPFQQHLRASTLESLDFDEQALAELRVGLKIAPDYAKLYQLAGKIYTKKKDVETAYGQFRLATALDLENQDNRYNLALALYELGKYEESVKQYEEIVIRWPHEVKGYFFLARSLARDKQYEKALDYLKKAHVMYSANVLDILKIGDVAVDNKEYDWAKKYYEIALDAPKEVEKVYLRLAKMYQRIGDKKQAEENYRKAVVAAPKNEEVATALKDFLEEPQLQP